MSSENAGLYRSYLLRCWREHAANPDEPAVWRFVLQDVSAAQTRYAFGSFEQVVDFLRGELMGDQGRSGIGADRGSGGKM